MSVIRRARELVRNADTHSESSASPTEPSALTNQAPPTLRRFLRRRQPLAERAFEQRKDLVAYAEAKLCREILTYYPDDDSALAALRGAREHPDHLVRTAAIGLLSGWRATGVRVPEGSGVRQTASRQLKRSASLLERACQLLSTPVSVSSVPPMVRPTPAH